jgi:hypothetical protein
VLLALLALRHLHHLLAGLLYCCLVLLLLLLLLVLLLETVGLLPALISWG